MPINFVHRNRKGFILPMTIVYITTTLIIGSGIIGLGSLGRIEANKKLHREQAFYLAEAGINFARAQLNADNSWTPGSDPVNLGDGSFQLQKTTNGNAVTITSIGTSGATKSVPVQITMLVDQTLGQYFSSTIFTSHKAILKHTGKRKHDHHNKEHGDDEDRGSSVYGNVGSNDEITVEDGTIFGDASVPHDGEIKVSSKHGYGGSITGTKSYTATPRNLVLIQVPAELSALAYPTSGITGVYEHDSHNDYYNHYEHHHKRDKDHEDAGKLKIKGHTVTLAAGDYRFRSIEITDGGKLVILGDSRILVTQKMKLDESELQLAPDSTLTLYIGDEELEHNDDGDLDAKKGSRINDTDSAGAPGLPSALRVYAHGDRKHHTFNDSIFKGLIYAPGRKETIELKNDTFFYGALVCYTFTIEDSDVYGNLPVAPKAKFVSWTKPDWKKQ